MNIPMVTDSFLDEFETNFDVDFVNYYKLQNSDKITNIMNDRHNLTRTTKEYDYHELKLPQKNQYDFAYENIVTFYEQLKQLTPVEATDARLWVALENTDFLPYHLKALQVMDYKEGKQESSIKSRSIFSVNGLKRSLAINNLASLWWMGYLLYDKQNEDHYHFVRAFTQTDFRGNFVAFSSSNVVDNVNIRMGILDAIFELVDKKVIKQNRHAFSDANKIMNIVGGTRILDLLSREEVKSIVLQKLPEYWGKK